MGDAQRGQVDTSAAEVYDSLFVPALFGRFAAVVADTAAVGPNDDAIDVACGTGALTRVVRSRTSGRVVGVDVNPAMLAVAARHGGQIDYAEGDAQNLPYEDGEFDVATCQFGLMFLTDPAKGVAELARVAGRGAVAVWDAIERSDGYSALQQLFEEELGPEAAASLDAPFSMGRPGVLEGLFAAAAVEPTSFRSETGTVRFDSIEQWVTTEVRGWTLGDSVSDERLRHLVATADRELRRYATDDGCRFSITALIGTW